METTSRALTLPREGYGPEPRTEADVMTLAMARLYSALPEGWTVRTNRQIGDLEPGTGMSVQPKATLSLVRDDTVVVTYRLETRQILNRGSALALAERLAGLDDSRGRTSGWVVTARYLSPQVQELLRARGIGYADATGAVFLTSQNPLVLLSDRGASADPWRGPGRPTTSLKGLPAARLVRALVDFAPPYTVPELGEVAGASLGATYRLVDYLTNEGLLTHTKREPITDVEWSELLLRWSDETRYLETSTLRGYVEPRGLDHLMDKLSEQPASRYALSGSLAAQPYAAYAEPRMALLYSEDPMRLAADLGLRDVDAGANVILAAPRSPVVFERTKSWRGATIVAPSQAVADLLAGPGRNPAEGDYLLDWMKKNPDAWRRELDR